MVSCSYLKMSGESSVSMLKECFAFLAWCLYYVCVGVWKHCWLDFNKNCKGIFIKCKFLCSAKFQCLFASWLFIKWCSGIHFGKFIYHKLWYRNTIIVWRIDRFFFLCQTCGLHTWCSLVKDLFSFGALFQVFTFCSWCFLFVYGIWQNYTVLLLYGGIQTHDECIDIFKFTTEEKRDFFFFPSCFSCMFVNHNLKDVTIEETTYSFLAFLSGNRRQILLQLKIKGMDCVHIGNPVITVLTVCWVFCALGVVLPWLLTVVTPLTLS